MAVRILPLALFLAASASFAAFAEDITVQLKWKHQFQFAGYYAAIEKGYYADAGLDVTLREADFDMVLEESVLSGEAQFGIGASELVLLRASGEPVVALAPIYQHSPYILLVTKDSGIENIHDLNGKRIMYEPHAAELLAYLQSEGIESWEVTLVTPTFEPAQLVSGEVDATSSYITDEPFKLEQMGVEYLAFSPRSGGIDFYGDTLFTTEGYLNSNRETVKRFLDATVEGWNYALENPEEIAGLIIEKYSDRHTREHLLFEAEQSGRLIMPDVVEIGYMNPGRWQHIASVYESLGMLEPGFSFDGFLYERDPRPDLTWLYLLLGGALAVIGIVSLVAVRFYQLHQKVKRHSEKLRRAIAETKVLRGLLPVCAHCKKVRNDDGFWQSVDIYIRTHSEAEISHGICPACLDVYYPEEAEEIRKELKEAADEAASAPEV